MRMPAVAVNDHGDDEDQEEVDSGFPAATAKGRRRRRGSPHLPPMASKKAEPYQPMVNAPRRRRPRSPGRAGPRSPRRCSDRAPSPRRPAPVHGSSRIGRGRAEEQRQKRGERMTSPRAERRCPVPECSAPTASAERARRAHPASLVSSPSRPARAEHHDQHEIVEHDHRHQAAPWECGSRRSAGCSR